MKVFGVLFLFLMAPAFAELEHIPMNRVSIIELLQKPDQYSGERIDVIGVLSVQNDEVFLCESLDACLSWSPARLRLDNESILQAMRGYQEAYDLCHVIVFAKFEYSEGNRNDEIGVLFGPLMRIQLSIERMDYHEINPRCSVWNEYVEKRASDKAIRKEIIENMRNVTR